MIKFVRYAKVKINYKSGISEVLHCTKFKVKGNAVSGLEVEYNVITSGKRASPLYMNVDEVESIYQVGYGWTFATQD